MNEREIKGERGKLPRSNEDHILNVLLMEGEIVTLRVALLLKCAIQTDLTCLENQAVTKDKNSSYMTVEHHTSCCFFFVRIVCTHLVSAKAFLFLL